MVVGPAFEQRDIAIFGPAERREPVSKTIEHVLARLPRAPPDKPDARDLAGRERRSAHQHRGGAKQQQRPTADAAAPRNPLCPNRHRGLPGRDSFLIFSLGEREDHRSQCQSTASHSIPGASPWLVLFCSSLANDRAWAGSPARRAGFRAGRGRRRRNRRPAWGRQSSIRSRGSDIPCCHWPGTRDRICRRH